MNEQQVYEVLRQYVARELLHGDDRGLDGKSPLLEWGVIESLSMMTLIDFIQDRFGRPVPDTEIRPENFVDLAAITRMVVRLSSEQQAS